MRELFVYYRIRPADVAAARAAVLAMQDALRRAHPGLAARLLTRVGEGDGDGNGSQTWMETYSLSAKRPGVAADLEAEIEKAATSWAALVAGPRHVEAFVVAGD
ncbi:MAG: DUF4936 family protein [Burkholderiales bacterium]|nr:DUF4936 family protein [Burkholderiales bacterium]